MKVVVTVGNIPMSPESPNTLLSHTSEIGFKLHWPRSEDRGPVHCPRFYPTLGTPETGVLPPLSLGTSFPLQFCKVKYDEFRILSVVTLTPNRAGSCPKTFWRKGKPVAGEKGRKAKIDQFACDNKWPMDQCAH